MKHFRHLTICAALLLSLGLASCRPVEPPSIGTESSEMSQSTTLELTTAPSETPPMTGMTLPSTTDETTTTTTELTTTPTTIRETTSEATTTPEVTEPTTQRTTRPTSEVTTSTRDPFDILDDIFNPGEPDAEPGTIEDPYYIGQTAQFDGYDTFFDPFRADVSVQQIYRGQQALQMVKDASSINPAPESGHEYLVAQVLVKVTASKNGESVGVSPYFFSLAREDGRMYGDVTLFRAITPVLSAIEVGETSIGYICFEVAKTDETPFIVFLSRAHGGLWFTTEEATEESDVTSVIYSKS